MPVMTFTEADLRDPMESAETCCEVEGPIAREEDGSCYCAPASTAGSEDGPPSEPSFVHLHLKIWGRKPDAAPRYFEIPLR